MWSGQEDRWVRHLTVRAFVFFHAAWNQCSCAVKKKFLLHKVQLFNVTDLVIQVWSSLHRVVSVLCCCTVCLPFSHTCTLCGPVSTVMCSTMVFTVYCTATYGGNDLTFLESSTFRFSKIRKLCASPAGSNMFGLLQLIGVWIISEWMGAGQPKQLQLVELGPGKGSLASDVIRVRQPGLTLFYERLKISPQSGNICVIKLQFFLSSGVQSVAVGAGRGLCVAAPGRGESGSESASGSESDRKPQPGGRRRRWSGLPSRRNWSRATGVVVPPVRRCPDRYTGAESRLWSYWFIWNYSMPQN